MVFLQENLMSLVGQPAPEWTAPAYLKGEEIDLNSGELNGKWYVLYFYPLDFTFVCPTEIIAFSAKMGEFKKRNTEVLGVSIDSHFSHLAWRNTDRKKAALATSPIHSLLT